MAVQPLRRIISAAPAPVAEQTAHRVLIIEGRRVAVFDRRPPLPARLDDLLEAPGMRLYPVRITGWCSQCSEQDHRLYPLADGRYTCLDGQRRDLRISMCADCESVCVRDVSVDWLPGLRTGSRMPRRRDKVLGWYSGARKNQRVYGVTPMR